ncbi:MAG: DUF126 domain-containing protein [Desulfurococcus sp.]|nr:DUF126 domain-containing protein [Desulfurococcus sp.]
MESWRVKVVVDGDCEGEPVLVDQYLSFLGEVEPARGVVKTEGEEVSISGKVLVFKGSRGSTVGSYIIYALKRHGKSPACMIVKEVEPILIAGCIIAEIPLLIAVDYEEFKIFLKGKKLLRYKRGSGVIYAE